ncbi:MAG: WD40/YVTN/BNR-like repeat-containing protein, partial [Terriglobales bacterium]
MPLFILAVAAAGLGAQEAPVAVAQQFEKLHFRSIGPASMSGRITDFTAYEANPARFFVASAHGGLWKTDDGGASFTPEFQDNGLMSVGAVTMSQRNPNLVWLGTGEGNDRQSISWGDGVWKSTDGGKTWKNMGLAHSYHINRIVIDPDDDNVVLVAAQGSLFGPGGDRGVYKTTDGGASWKQVLGVDADTGANDLVMAAADHRVLYASSFQRRRSQCCFNGGGPGSGVWKSTDGGDTWKRLSGGGLPSGPLGRIALAVYRHSENIVYAEIQGETPPGGRGAGAATGAGSAGGGRGAAPATATGVYRSDDGGLTWRKFADPDNRPVYFSKVRIDPGNPARVLVASVRLYLSTDGARTFFPIDPSEHDDKHGIWWDPGNSNHLLIGTDGGAYTTWDMGKSWIWFPNLPVGLFYHVGFDNAWPYNVCGGMQDNYDWCGPSAVRTTGGISNDRWQTIQGGDGFVAILDPRDNRTVFSETQDGATMRHDRITGESKSIRPTPQNVVNAQAGGLGCDPPKAAAEAGRGGGAPCAGYRFNWDTPMLFSPNDPGVLYIAGNHVFRSTDRGDSWTAVSPDLTTDADRDQMALMGVKGADVRISKNDGISAWPTIVSFAESPKQPGLYYAGTDDGTVSVSRDGGKTWDKALAERMPGFVSGAWVSKVLPSRYDAGTVYVASDAHRLNDYETHIWVSHDFGATFQSLNGNLHGQAIKTLTEDLRNPDVLYAGAETGIFLTLDRGRSWQRLKANLPTVRVDEITIQPRENAMLVATHGRALWILDHLAPIQEYAAAQSAAADAHLFSPDPALEWKAFGDKNEEFWAHQYFMGENPPKQAVLQYDLKNAASNAQLAITDAAGNRLRQLTLSGARLQPGIQSACWDFRVDPLPAPAAAAGRGGRGGAGRGGSNVVWAQPQPQPGYGAADPCAGEAGTAGGRGGFGAAGASQGPMVPAG